jgi:hypothetical protein
MSGLLLTLLGPVVIGPLTFALMQGIKAVNVTVDALPPIAKRVAVVAIAVFLTFLASALQLDIACDVNSGANCLAALDQDTVKAIVSAVVAFALHWLKNLKKG